MTAKQHNIVIIGGGTGGISVAALLRRQQPNADILLIDPAEYHYYQPAWTLVGGGAYSAQATRRSLQAVLPKGVSHLQAKVNSFQPDDNRVTLDNGDAVAYSWLVVAAGIQCHWDAIDGLQDTLGKNGVTSNYHYDYAPYTWELVKQFQGGRAIFTQPAGAIKCPGAPQKAVYLSADYFEKQGINVEVEFRTATPSVFGIPFYAEPLNRVMESHQATPYFKQSLVAVNGAEKIATFEYEANGETQREDVAFDLLHVVPPQSAPDFIRESTLANAQGWLEVDQYSLKHVKYHNIYGLGDCTSSPNSKTCAAIKAQAPVLTENLLNQINGVATEVSYDGYAACPVTTSNGKVLLAEFTFGGAIAPSLPIDPRKPRRIYWWLKRTFLPWFYWNLLLKGHKVPATHRTREFDEALPSTISP